MQNPGFPNSNGKETGKWPDKSFKGPSIPKAGPQETEQDQMSMFFHPAEKPQFNAPVYRERLYDTIF